MKRVGLIIAALCAFGGLAQTAAAGETPAVPEIKRVALIRIERLFDGYKYVTERRERINGILKPNIDELDRLRQQIETKMQEAQRPGFDANGADGRRLQLEVESLQLDGREKAEKFQQMAAQYNSELYLAFYDDLVAACRDFAKYFNYDMIITANEAELPQQLRESNNAVAIEQQIILRHFIYAGPNVDQTESILQYMNNRYDNRTTR